MGSLCVGKLSERMPSDIIAAVAKRTCGSSGQQSSVQGAHSVCAASGEGVRDGGDVETPDPASGGSEGTPTKPTPTIQPQEGAGEDGAGPDEREDDAGAGTAGVAEGSGTGGGGDLEPQCERTDAAGLVGNPNGLGLIRAGPTRLGHGRLIPPGQEYRDSDKHLQTTINILTQNAMKRAENEAQHFREIDMNLLAHLRLKASLRKRDTALAPYLLAQAEAWKRAHSPDMTYEEFERQCSLVIPLAMDDSPLNKRYRAWLRNYDSVNGVMQIQSFNRALDGSLIAPKDWLCRLYSGLGFTSWSNKRQIKRARQIIGNPA